uniref:Uncharacterized protein n=1 Tax=Setaria viridis TaxID=4556 RepID=A0A4U6WEQ5_SETVI|nr:hypothetical protein SEVIR_1G188300v2 [Setaria viridis]
MVGPSLPLAVATEGQVAAVERLATRARDDLATMDAPNLDAMDARGLPAPIAQGLAAAVDDVAMPEGSMDGEAPPPAIAIALARSWLPTAPRPVTEYNLPVLDVHRSTLEPMENMPRVDWDSLQIVETHDDEGRIALLSENQMCELLGLREDETHAGEGQMNEHGVDNEQGVDNDGAAIPTSDAVPMELPFVVGAPLPKGEAGRRRKLRLKGCLEGGHKKKGAKDGKGPTEAEGVIGGDNATAPTNAKGKKMIRGPMTCKRCGEKGHRQASSKCPLNGTAKKRQQRQPSKNVTKAAPQELSTPQRPTREEIPLDSTGRVTRSQLAFLLGEGSSSQTDTTSPVRMPTASAPKKMTPKKRLHIG